MYIQRAVTEPLNHSFGRLNQLSFSSLSQDRLSIPLIILAALLCTHSSLLMFKSEFKLDLCT